MDIQETTQQLVQHTFQAITDKQSKDVLGKLVKTRTQFNVICKRHFQMILCNFLNKSTSLIELMKEMGHA